MAMTMTNTFHNTKNMTSYGRPIADNRDLAKVSSNENSFSVGRYTAADKATRMISNVAI
jgi:hypothetical protein